MFAIGFCVGAMATAPVFWLRGCFAFLDGRITHERADIRSALRRTSR